MKRDLEYTAIVGNCNILTYSVNTHPFSKQNYEILQYARNIILRPQLNKRIKILTGSTGNTYGIYKPKSYRLRN